MNRIQKVHKLYMWDNYKRDVESGKDKLIEMYKN